MVALGLEEPVFVKGGAAAAWGVATRKNDRRRTTRLAFFASACACFSFGR